MFTSEKFADVTPRLLCSSESDEARGKELEVDLADQNLSIGSLVPTSNIDNSVFLEDRVEDAEGVDLGSGPAYAVVRKLKAHGFLELGHYAGWAKGPTRAASLLYISWLDFRCSLSKPVVRRARNFLPSLGLGIEPRGVGAAAVRKKDVAVAWLSPGWRGEARRCVSVHIPRPQRAVVTVQVNKVPPNDDFNMISRRGQRPTRGSGSRARCSSNVHDWCVISLRRWEMSADISN